LPPSKWTHVHEMQIYHCFQGDTTWKRGVQSDNEWKVANVSVEELRKRVRTISSVSLANYNYPDHVLDDYPPQNVVIPYLSPLRHSFRLAAP
jgi:hypothetical protein